MSSTSRAWMVAGTVGVVEALKDQGFARWNYAVRTIHHHAKSNLRSISHTKNLSSPAAMASSRAMEDKLSQSEESLRKVIRVWMAAGVAIVNGHTDQGCKLKSLVTNSFRHANFNSSQYLRPFSSLLRSNVSISGDRKTQSDDSIRQVMYINCWGPS
ncbi:hypothetical protein OSB04_022489 [Centaurea solstitialis]|uniref:Wound-responsive family protein n=1 Tax=Centaurea solstitialis TaxID=347529 RepID=A0AA38T9Q9_9ASTR|nr:hypothetical protein OSB04_022489 [Centaurea solstitialis]